MFSKLLDKISSNKKNILWIIGGFLLFFLLSDSVFAADTALVKAKATASSAMSWIGATLTLFLSLLTYLTTVFLSPEWINGSLFGLNSYFKSIWILVSNVVYLIFAFIIIWIAFMNIIGKGQEKYALKQALPKFIVGILIVPFSWFLVQFILSMSAVLTISALNIPFESFPQYKTVMDETKIPNNCTLNLKSIGPSDTKTSTTTKTNENSFFSCEDKEVAGNSSTIAEILNSGKASDSIFGIISTYTYGVLGLENISKLNANDLSNINTMGDLVVKLLFDVLFVLVYSILLVALGMVLLVRGIYIWIYMMISPLFGLMYFFDKTSGGGEFFDKFNVKQFISLAMVPVYSMLALSFGLLFLFVIGNGMTDKKSDVLQGVQIQEVASKDSSKIVIGGDSNGKGGFSLSVVGSPANPQDITNFGKNIGNDALGVIGTLIMKIFGIVVLWGAVMAALRSNEMTKAIVEPLHAFGAQVGGLVTKAPQYAPIFGGQSMTSLGQIGSSASSYFETKARDRGTDFMKKHELFGQNGSIDLSNKSINALTTYKANGLTKNTAEAYKLAYNEGKTVSDLVKSQQFIEVTKAIAEGLKIEGAKDIKVGMDENALAKIIGDIDSKSQNSQGGFSGSVDIVGTINNPGGGAVTAKLLNEAKLKQQNNSTSTTTNGNQTINLNINGVGTPINIPESITSPTIKSDIETAISNVGVITDITKLDFINKIKTELISKGISDIQADSISKEVASKITNFKTN
ncbi:MAG: hypothetical protein PHV23_02460 [Candidatus Gracilibacteria bacterium]|nr:hypothetical protein [Candidatus Gracilibacteria bacterium]